MDGTVWESLLCEGAEQFPIDKESGKISMADFLTLFQNYASESKISDSTFAKASGLSRAYINKIRNGKKFCKNNAEDELKLAYQMQLSDDNGYMIVDAVSQLIKSFASIAMERDNMILVKEEVWPEQKIYYYKENIMIVCRKLIEQEAVKRDGHIRLLMQPGQVQIQEALKWGLRNNSDFQVDQLIGLEKTAGNNYLKKTNVELLQQLVPIILSQQKLNYRVYYHYEWMTSYLSIFRIASHFLITGSQVLCINDDFSQAILWSGETSVTHFAKVFDDMIRKADMLYFTSADPVGVYADFFVDASDNCPAYTMGGQPCLGIAANDAMFEKYAIDLHSNEVMQRLLQFNQKVRQMYHTTTVVAYFTRRGLQRLLETGWLEEIPQELYHPLELEDRKALIRNLIDLARKGNYEPHLIDEAQFDRYPVGLVIDCYSENDIVVYYHTDFVEKHFIIKEVSLANCFYQYMEWMRTSSKVCSVEETLAYLENLITV